MMKFSTPSQIVGLTVLWTGVLFGEDYAHNPRPIGSFFDVVKSEEHAVSIAGDKPRLDLWMNHMCCSGCIDDLRAALKALPWVGGAEVVRDSALPAQQSPDTGQQAFGNRVHIDIADLERLDFVQLDEAIRGMGLTVERTEFTGPTHFRIEAELKHVCCPMCSGALTRGMDLAKIYRSTGQFGWVDSVAVNKQARRVIAYAKYGKTVDVTEWIAALGKLGFAPSSVKVMKGDEP